MLTGFTPPFTPSGRSALIPAPPWHYAGQVMSLAFHVDQKTAQDLLPEGFGTATGNAACHFCEWQATTDGSEMLDPIYAQYKECFVVTEVEHSGKLVLYCPFIYVDQDLSIVRGWMQGWPKKMGSVWMTRSYGLNHPAAAPFQKGVRFGASLAVKDRRLAEAQLILTGEEADPIGFLSLPAYSSASLPSLTDMSSPGRTILMRAVTENKVQGRAYAATGTLNMFDSPHDELSLLQPESVSNASISTFALSVTGASKE
jgi:hypothetical protein